MNKNFKVITINGIRGVIAVVFFIFGLAAGFIISPGWVCMQFWNYLFKDSSVVSTMNIYQGIMLWAVIALTLYALNGKKSLIGFGTYKGLSPEQIKDIMYSSDFSENEIIKSIESNEILNQSEIVKEEENKAHNDMEKDEVKR